MSSTRPTLDPRRLSADDLRYLMTVANTGRLTAAAAALGVNHTTVSRRISALEHLVGVRLLEKGADGWELTQVGRTVAEQSRPIEQALEQVALAISGEAEDSLTGTFRITAPDGFGTTFVTPTLIRLHDRHPNLNFELITATRQLNLHQAGFDLAIAVGAPTSSRLFTERLTDYTLAPYASKAYLARHGTPADLDELKTHTVVFYIDSLVQVGDLDLNQYAPGLTARFTSTNILAQLEATRLGAGVGLLPRFLASGVPELVALSIAGMKQIRLSFTLAARRDSITRPAVQAVRAALHQEVRLRRNELLNPEMESSKRRTRNDPTIS